jgi:hypothetical protein
MHPLTWRVDPADEGGDYPPVDPLMHSLSRDLDNLNFDRLGSGDFDISEIWELIERWADPCWRLEAPWGGALRGCAAHGREHGSQGEAEEGGIRPPLARGE